MPPPYDDELALRRLAETYARYADRCDGRRLAELFVPGGQLRIRRPGELTPSTTLHGHAEIAAAIDRLTRYDATFHLVANHIAACDGDDATAEVYCLAHHVTGRGDGHDEPRDHVMVIRYIDRCRRGADGWRFVERELQVDWTEERVVTAAPAARRA